MAFIPPIIPRIQQNYVRRPIESACFPIMAGAPSLNHVQKFQRLKPPAVAEICQAEARKLGAEMTAQAQPATSAASLYHVQKFQRLKPPAVAEICQAEARKLGAEMMAQAQAQPATPAASARRKPINPRKRNYDSMSSRQSISLTQAQLNNEILMTSMAPRIERSINTSEENFNPISIEVKTETDNVIQMRSTAPRIERSINTSEENFNPISTEKKIKADNVIQIRPLSPCIKKSKENSNSGSTKTDIVRPLDEKCKITLEIMCRIFFSFRGIRGNDTLPIEVVIFTSTPRIWNHEIYGVHIESFNFYGCFNQRNMQAAANHCQDALLTNEYPPVYLLFFQLPVTRNTVHVIFSYVKISEPKFKPESFLGPVWFQNNADWTS